MKGIIAKEELFMYLSKLRMMQRVLFFSTAGLLFVIVFSGCHGAPAGDRLRVDKLDGGDFYQTAAMVRPRYEHKAMTLDDGTVLVVGGSDERTFTTIDSCEIFDQKLTVEPEPPSKTGGWIDTDFEGNSLQLEGGGRIYHQLVRADNGNVMVHEGVRDGLLGELVQHPELYDRTTRKFTEISATMKFPRFHSSVVSISEGEFLFFGGQIHVDTTVVDSNYPPNDPRFIQQVDSYPSTPSIEKYDSSLDSEDGNGNFELLKDNNGAEVKMITSLQGRALHSSVRLAGVDRVLGNAGDVFVHVGGIKTLSPLFAPKSKLRRMEGSELVKDIEVYDGFTMSSFLMSSVALRYGRAHAVQGENLGWHDSTTFDGISGLSNVFMVYGGSTDTLPTTGRWICEGFAASFTGFGPGAGIELMRTEFSEGETIISVLQNTIGSNVNTDLVTQLDTVITGVDPNGAALLAVRVFEPGLFESIRAGKFFGTEAAFINNVDPLTGLPGLFLDNAQYYGEPIQRTHSDTVHVLRNVFTDYGPQQIGNLFTGGGGIMYPVMGGQYQEYNIPPLTCGEYYDPFYNLINAFYAVQHNPYDLSTVRTYWSIQDGVPFPVAGSDNKDHPNPTGSHGAWLVTDGFIPQDGFEGYRWLPPYTQDPDSLVLRFLQKGRAWHTLNIIPGEDGELGTPDDRILFIGGGDDILLWGGSPVVPSAEIYVPKLNQS